MTGSPFAPEYRTAGFMPRWSIVWTRNPDSVASHSFFVALYAAMIAETIQWPGNREYMLMKALTHDLDETVMGDIPGPAKNTILDQGRLDDFVSERMKDRMGFLLDTMEQIKVGIDQWEIEEGDAIVHAADKLDAVYYLKVDARMGNQVVANMANRMVLSAEGAWRALPGDPHDLSRLWQTVVLPSIKMHETTGGEGV